MNIKDLKEAVGEMMNEIFEMDPGEENISQVALDKHDDEEYKKLQFRSLSSKASEAERKVLKILASLTYKGAVGNKSVEDMVQIVGRHAGLDMGGWPVRKEAWKDFNLDPKAVAEYVCSVVAMGRDGYYINLGDGKPEACPKHWGIKPKSLKPSSTGSAGATPTPAEASAWRKNIPKEEKPVWRAMAEIYDESAGRGMHFRSILTKAAADAGVSIHNLSYLTQDLGVTQAMAEKTYLSESKKRGFGEGEPPNEEIYKKREVVQEIDAETPDVAKELGDASKEQGETTQGVADAHTRGAEAAKQRQDASKAWKDAKITQIKAVDAAEKHADQEAKAMDAQSKAMDAAQKAADAVEKSSAEKEKMLDVAKQAAEQEQEAAESAQEAAAAEEEAATELADTNAAAAKAGEERSGLEAEFGDAITSDEESRDDEEEEKKKEAEEADAAEEETKKKEEEADKQAKDAEREAADDEAAAGAAADDKEADANEDEDEEPQGMTEILKSMVREVLSERKWGEKGGGTPTLPEKIQASGLTADDLRGMVLQTVMKGEEERDNAMLKLLQSMLDSLQSIEYHTTPIKGAGSAHAQAAAKNWVNESKNKRVFSNIPSLLSEMREVGLQQEADDHESFFKWALANSDLTMQEIKNEADAQIADLKKMLRKLSDHTTGKEDSLEKQKLRGEVPGHH
jgi:hypothetical protein